MSTSVRLQKLGFSQSTRGAQKCPPTQGSHKALSTPPWGLVCQPVGYMSYRHVLQVDGSSDWRCSDSHWWQSGHWSSEPGCQITLRLPKRSGVLLFSITVAATVAAQPRVQSVHSELQGTLRKALYRKPSCIFKFLICLRSFLSSLWCSFKTNGNKSRWQLPSRWPVWFVCVAVAVLVIINRWVQVCAVSRLLFALATALPERCLHKPTSGLLLCSLPLCSPGLKPTLCKSPKRSIELHFITAGLGALCQCCLLGEAGNTE